jgi:hypothetical protein
MEVFEKMWPEAWGVRIEHILRNVLMALLEQPASLLVQGHELHLLKSKPVPFFSDAVKELKKEYGSYLACFAISRPNLRDRGPEVCKINQHLNHSTTARRSIDRRQQAMRSQSRRLDRRAEMGAPWRLDAPPKGFR